VICPESLDSISIGLSIVPCFDAVTDLCCTVGQALQPCWSSIQALPLQSQNQTQECAIETVHDEECAIEIEHEIAGVSLLVAQSWAWRLELGVE
jgi:hypothetical protein